MAQDHPRVFDHEHNKSKTGPLDRLIMHMAQASLPWVGFLCATRVGLHSNFQGVMITPLLGLM